MVLRAQRAQKSCVLQKRISGLCVIVLAQARASTHDFLFTLCTKEVCSHNSELFQKLRVLLVKLDYLFLRNTYRFAT